MNDEVRNLCKEIKEVLKEGGYLGGAWYPQDGWQHTPGSRVLGPGGQIIAETRYASQRLTGYLALVSPKNVMKIINALDAQQQEK